MYTHARTKINTKIPMFESARKSILSYNIHNMEKRASERVERRAFYNEIVESMRWRYFMSRSTVSLCSLKPAINK